MNIEVRKLAPEYDHDAIYVNRCYVGFVGKEDGCIGLERCPVCGKENYAPSVMSGICVWCGFDLGAAYGEWLKGATE